MTIAEQLTEIYYKYEYWHENLLKKDVANRYHEKLLNQGNIVVYVESGRVLGYFEVWRINFEQFGRKVCGVMVDATSEDILTGNIALVNNVWIHPDFRNSYVYKYLRDIFFAANFECEYYVGFANRKKTQPIKVFTRNKLSSSLFREGII